MIFNADPAVIGHGIEQRNTEYIEGNVTSPIVKMQFVGVLIAD